MASNLTDKYAHEVQKRKRAENEAKALRDALRGWNNRLEDGWRELDEQECRDLMADVAGEIRAALSDSEGEGCSEDHSRLTGRRGNGSICPNCGFDALAPDSEGEGKLDPFAAADRYSDEIRAIDSEGGESFSYDDAAEEAGMLDDWYGGRP